MSHSQYMKGIATEMYKVKNNICPKPCQELFTPSIRGNNDWVIPKVRIGTGVQRPGK